MSAQADAACPAPVDTGRQFSSGKGSGDENFPVGSFLLPGRIRPHVAAYYAFARAADDIADCPALRPEDKVERLKAFDSVLRGHPDDSPGFRKVCALRASMEKTGVSTVYGSDLLSAFIQDCTKDRYATWDELLAYCALSANPVGRYLLDLHGEDPGVYPLSDALCTVLQILNHIQDCGDDRRNLDRVYIVGDWMKEEGTSDRDLDRNCLADGMRRVLDRMLDRCEGLMSDARLLPGALVSRRLAMESAVIIRLADRLAAMLRRRDPLAERIVPGKKDFILAGITGAVSGFFRTGRRVCR